MSLVPSCKASLAVIDSGVGGLSVLAELRRILPYNSIIYYADTANCPYGQRSTQEIIELGLAVVQRVVEMGAKVVVVACNTMTAAAINRFRELWSDVDFVGMEPAVKPALNESKRGIVGVLATSATLKGELYRTTKQRNQEGREVIEVAGIGLVEFVESGRCQTDECKELVRSYVEPMLERGADRIVLGCTHYPFLEGVIRDVVSEYFSNLKNGDLLIDNQPEVEIINPAPAVARRAKRVISERQLLVDSESEGLKGEVFYYTSGNNADETFLKAFLKSANLEF